MPQYPGLSEAIDAIIEQCIDTHQAPESYYRNLTANFEHGLKLVRERTGRTRFFLTRDALERPEAFIADLLKQNGVPVQLPFKPEKRLED